MDIEPQDKLLRWLHPSQFKWDEERPISAAFKDDYMSVDVAKLTTVQESYDRGKKYGKNAVVSLKAEIVQQRQQKIHYCPTSIRKEVEPETNVCTTNQECKTYQQDISQDDLKVINDAHACVIGKKPNSIAKFFAKNAEVEIYPPDSP